MASDPALRPSLTGPPVWKVTVDPTSQKPYWYDQNNTSTRTWEDPTGGAVSVPPTMAAVHPHAQPAVHDQAVITGAQDSSAKWNSSRFGCFDDFGVCVMGCCCGCVIWAQTMERAKLLSCFPAFAKIVGSSCCVWFAIVIIGIVLSAVLSTEIDLNQPGLIAASLVVAAIGTSSRRSMAQKYGLEFGNSGTEFICWWCCSCCSCIQEYKTIKDNVDNGGHWIVQMAQPVSTPVQTTVVMAHAPSAHGTIVTVAVPTQDQGKC